MQCLHDCISLIIVYPDCHTCVLIFVCVHVARVGVYMSSILMSSQHGQIKLHNLLSFFLFTFSQSWLLPRLYSLCR